MLFLWITDVQDLGVLVHSNLKVSEQCTKVVKSANRILGMINRSFVYKSSNTILTLYKSLVRPHLEYCVQAWCPHLRKDIDLLEKVQRRATRLIKELRGTSYEERLVKLGLTTLENRRLRGDMIEVFKIIKGFDNVPVNTLFELSSCSLRGHSLKLYKDSFKTNIGKFSFANRVIQDWNNLPDDVVSSNTINTFKNRFDRHIRSCRGFK